MIKRISVWLGCLSLAVLGAPWVWWHERRILREGEELPLDLARWAGDGLGLEAVEETRVLEVKEVPLPSPLWVRKVCAKLGFPTLSVGGLCLRRGIYLQKGKQAPKATIRHELVHTMQYQRAGSVRGFLQRYLYECIIYGYEDAPMEVEARTRSADKMTSGQS